MLAVAVMVASVPLFTSHASKISVSPGTPVVSNGITYSLNNDGKLTISGSGEIEEKAFFMDSSIISVVIEDGITGIGDEAFYKCSKLTSVSLPGSMTSIGNSAFSRCTKLASVTIPSSVTAIGDNQFTPYFSSLSCPSICRQCYVTVGSILGHIFTKIDYTFSTPYQSFTRARRTASYRFFRRGFSLPSN